MSAADDVRAASQRFYAALNEMANGNASSMAATWSHAADVTAMHPIGGRQVGWDAVRASFEGVSQAATEGAITLKDQLVRVAGDVAWEMGTEQGHFKLAGEPIAIEHRVTNIYQRESGGWKLVHHHTDVSPTMLDAARRLQR